MQTINYLQVVGCEHDAAMKAKRKKAIGKTTDKAREDYEGFPRYITIIN